MNIYIYDIEVFKHDWIIVFRNVNETIHKVIHNNNHALYEFIQQNIVLGGFNNKFYDDWVLSVLLNGGDNAMVKRINDHIISGKNGWEFPFLQFKKKQFKSFDLRDDLPTGLSLKAIEAHMGKPIVETGVSFDIDRPLTADELESTIMYCKTDVDNTVELYFKRQDYIESKKTVAKIKGMDEVEAIGLTNAKLTARFLDAKKRNWDDEFDYTPPSELQLGKYEYVLEFFNDPVAHALKELGLQLARAKTDAAKKRIIAKIEKQKLGDRYDCKLKTTIAKTPHVYGWGGIHGARNNYFGKSDEKYIILNIDVASYYPSLMLQYNYISRNIPSSEGYAEIYNTRMAAKKAGDKETANALKLVLNTCYGAMKNQYNDLYDPRNASAICITGQLFLTDLIDKLELIEGFELIQSNTDGIMIKIPRYMRLMTEWIVSEWEQRTRMEMEYTEVAVVAQKDVNNYVMKTTDGKIKTCGGYVSLYDGGDFKNKSLVVLHRAVVDYLMNGVPVEETVLNCTNVQDFQIIAKTGSTYDGAYHLVEGEKVPVQKVNRVYATTNKDYGTVYKVKTNGRADKIASLPEHCTIANDGIVPLDVIDKQFYIDLAKKRINDYIGGKHE